MKTSLNKNFTPEEMVEQLRALRRAVPEYVQLTVAAKRGLHRSANADPQFLTTSINAVGASSVLASTLGQTAEELQQDMTDTSRWSAVEDELKAMLDGVRTANLTRRYRLGVAALMTYNISRQLVRRPEHANLLPHVKEMRRLNPFGQRAKKPVPPDVFLTTTQNHP